MRSMATLHVAVSALFLTCNALASANRRPPLGWSSWYAMGSGVNQSAMEQTFSKLTNRSVVPG